MKKYAICAVSLALTAVLFTGCGCQNSKPMNTEPSTLPPTTGATLPTTLPTTAPTTMPTTEPATESIMPSDTGIATDGMDSTEQSTENTGDMGAHNRTPSSNG